MVYTGRFLPDDIDCHTDSKGGLACFPDKGFEYFSPSVYFAALHIALFFKVVNFFLQDISTAPSLCTSH
jgi:hypothetical protein